MDALEQYAFVETRWGTMGLVARDEKLIATVMPSSDWEAMSRLIGRRWPAAEPKRNLFGRLQRQIRAYFEGCPVAFDVPLDLSRMTPFQSRILSVCRKTPYGRTTTYARLAAAAGHPSAARAVGAAMAANPIPLIIPCHRVVRTDGGLGGYSAPGGLALKRRLLSLEVAGLSVGSRRVSV